jgi:hypothetical protein
MLLSGKQFWRRFLQNLQNTVQLGQRSRSPLRAKTLQRNAAECCSLESLEDRCLLAVVGYYDMLSGQGVSSQVAAITAAGHTPVQLTDLTTADLSGVDVIDIQNPDNFAYGTEYLSRLASIQNAVSNGKVLVIHDRYVDQAESILPGGGGFNVVRDFSDPADIDVLDNTTLVTNGPGGVINNSTLDGGSSSSHGFAISGSLPGTSKRILSTGDPTHIVTFSYSFGSGSVIYSSIPLDYYRSQPAYKPGFSNIYAPNVLAYAATLTNTPPTAEANGPYSVNEGGTVTLSAAGSSDPDGSISLYEWDLDNNGSFETSGASPVFSAAGSDGPTTRTVRLRIRDNDGAYSAIDNATVNVANVAPTVSNVVLTPVINEDGIATLSGTIIDPSSLDSFTLTVNWGEGAPQTYNLPAGSTTFSVSHQYLDDNPSVTSSDTYNVSATLMDDDGGSAVLSDSLELLTNGSFETGNFNGWTTSGLTQPYVRNPQVVSAGTGGYGFVAAPTDGAFAVLAGFDGSGPGTMRIAQEVTIPSGSNSVLTFDWRAMWSHSQLPRTLSVNVETLAGASLGSFLVYTTTPPGNADTGHQTSTVNLSAFAGQTVRVAIDQYIPQYFTGPAQMQIDNVSLLSTQPLSVTVNNVAPTLSSVVVTPSIDENGVATLSGTITDPGTQDSFSLTVNWSDGVPQTYNLPAGSTSFSVSHQYLDDNPTGTASDIYVVSGTLTDDDGASVALGGISGSGSGVVTEIESNDSVASAQSIDGNWSLAFNSNIGDTTTNTSTIIPHVTVFGTGNNSVDVYEFTVPSAGARGIFDIDFGMPDFDPWLYLRNSSGTILATSDDAPTSYGQGGSVHPFDSYLEYIFPAGGVYYIEVGRYPSGQNIPSGADYQLQVSLDTLLAVNVTNVAPDILTLSATSVNEDGTVTLSGTYSDVGTQDTHTLTINWGEGAPVTLPVSGGTFSFTHQYLDDNPTNSSSDVYTISVTLTDDDTGTDVGSATTTITNVNPEILTLCATSVNEEGTVTLSGTYSDVGTQDTHTLTINWGEGAPVTFPVSGGSFSFTHQYLDDNPTNSSSDVYTIGVTLTDDDTGTDVGSATTTITNVNPEILTLSATSVNEDGTVTLSGTYSDVGTQDTHTLTINWGEGAPVTLPVSGGTFSFTHQYLDDNPTNSSSDVYTISVTLTDDDTGTDVGSATTTITNVNPEILTLSATSVNEDGTVTLSGTYSDVGTQDTHTLTINWGEGAPVTLPVSGGTFSFTHQYLDDNPTNSSSDVYTISVTLTDDDTGTDVGSATTTITNVNPVITGLSNTSPECGDAAEGQSITVSGSFTDIGTQDTHTATIDWGDGNVTVAVIGQGAGFGTLTDSHAYATGGIFTITVTLTDDDGGVVSSTTTAVITGVGVVGDTLYAIGTHHDDHITINKAGSVYRVHADFLTTGNFRDVPMAGISRIVVQVCDGDDHVTISSGISLAALIDGGAGDDKLNGGNGPNIILGGDGDDQINGGNARDLLIGGRGSDRLVGNGNEDILIGGWTDHDTFDPSGYYSPLWQLMNEWDDSSSQSDRRSHLTGALAGGLNGSALLNAATVHDDGVQDKLTGSSGIDWFFANLTGGSFLDVITDKSGNELLEELL